MWFTLTRNGHEIGSLWARSFRDGAELALEEYGANVILSVRYY